MGMNSAEKTRVENLEKLVKKLEKSNEGFKTQVTNLQTALKSAVQEMNILAKQNNDLRKEANLQNYRRDELEQYGRRESLRLHSVEEEKDEDTAEKNHRECKLCSYSN